MLQRPILATLAVVAAALVTDAHAQQVDKWMLIGTRAVDLSKGSESVDVSKAKGRVKAILLQVNNNPIALARVQVIYNNGTMHDEDRRINLRAGERTRPIDLRSEERFVDRVNLFLEFGSGTRGTAMVAIWALQSPAGVLAVRSSPSDAPQLTGAAPPTSPDAAAPVAARGPVKKNGQGGGPSSQTTAVLTGGDGTYVRVGDAGEPRSPTASELAAMPQFEWPPPKASGRLEIPRQLLTPIGEQSLTLGHVARRLQNALVRAGYDHSFYRIGANGVALVTRIEKMAKDGTPDRRMRWQRPSDKEPFSLTKYVGSLLWTASGHYRVIVFTVAAEDLTRTGTDMSSRRAESLVPGGAGNLPRWLADQSYTDGHTTFAIIYEYEKEKPDSTPVLLDPSRLSAMQHLQKATIWAALQGRPAPTTRWTSP